MSQQANLLKNIVYIDGANLHLGFKTLGRELDYKRFRRWLLDKYKIHTAYIFMGYIPEQKSLYDYLENCGFELIFKETVKQKGVVKGNADAEMILKTVRDFYEEDTESVTLISGDGDFSCLVDFLLEKQIFGRLMIPNIKYCSYLLRKKQISLVRLDHPRTISLYTKRASGRH